VLDLRQALAHNPPSGGTEPRPLPRLRGDETERWRSLKGNPRTAKKPINLGGVVSGIKHTILSRRCV